MEFITTYGLFLAKTITLVVAILIVLAAAVANASKGKKAEKGNISVTNLNEEIEDFSDEIKHAVVDDERLKLEYKAEKKKAKAEHKEKKKSAKQEEPEEARKRLYVIDFDGDTKASQVDDLRKVITAILAIARPNVDEVLLRLESPGGMVHGYGLAASQLDRIRKKNIPLTICVDKVAASGGYMMACLGTKIIAAPFAYIGSVGVVMQLPNFHRLLKDNKVDFEMITAGQYKRTLTMFGENSDADREKVTEEIQETHDLFKDFVKQSRPSLNIDEIATGETWFGTKALEMNLIDEVKTSDECITEACAEADVYAISYEHKKKIADRLGVALESSLDKTLFKWLHRSSNKDAFLS